MEDAKKSKWIKAAKVTGLILIAIGSGEGISQLIHSAPEIMTLIKSIFGM
jgi:hypothetical protein